jgi:hypothetical protein
VKWKETKKGIFHYSLIKKNINLKSWFSYLTDMKLLEDENQNILTQLKEAQTPPKRRRLRVTYSPPLFYKFSGL